MLEHIFRSEWSRVVAIIAKRFGDLDLAEDVASEAFASAAEHWRGTQPSNPRAWLVATARNAAINRLRRARLFDKFKPLLAQPETFELERRDELVPDDRLELIFACAHPYLALDAQVALTLRAVIGLSTERIAEVFLVPAETMKRRLTRAKQKIRETRITFTIGAADALPERINAVLAVLFLIFNEGYLPGGELAEEALYLARVLCSLLPSRAEVHGLLALMLFLHSRSCARWVDGRLVLFREQDRGSWNRPMIYEGHLSLQRALALDDSGPYALQAMIERERMSENPDGTRIVEMYGRLAEITGSPVVRLNQAVAIAEVGQVERALALVDCLPLDGYLYFHSTRAQLLQRLGHVAEAVDAYHRAFQLASREAERNFLRDRLAELSP